MSPIERLQLAQRLGDEALLQYARVHGLDLATAELELERRKQIGRRHSACACR
jgi:hypothetical protein